MSDQKPDKENSTDVNSDKSITRCVFLRKSAFGIVGTGLINFFPFMSLTSKSQRYPFQLGVASGDPWPHSVVLWTRLAPRPLVGGGMGNRTADVTWELARDQSFNKIVRQGTANATPKYAHSLHVEVDELSPDTWYYYRFKTNGETSPAGRTKTAPARDANIDELNIGFASCQNYPAGYYNAYNHLVQEDLDVVFFLGDYIYQGAGQGHIGRGHRPQKPIRTLNDYRIRYGQYKSDPSLQAAHAAFPWIVTFDDHEVKNNWAGKYASADSKPSEDTFIARRKAAFQAYYEHMPVRKMSVPHNIDLHIYRDFTYGNLAQFDVLDTRQFRTNFACSTSGVTAPCPEQTDPSRTMLGDKQEQWLFNNLKESSARWNIIPQQVMMAQGDRKKGPGTSFSMDKWDGYAATRKRLFDVVKRNDINNMIVLTGDSHKNWANNLLEDFNNPDSPVLAAELMGTSIASGGDGSDLPDYGKKLLAENPWIKFFNAQRGYVRCKITPENICADFRVVPYVSKPGAPIHTRATFKVENGTPGVQQV